MSIAGSGISKLSIIDQNPSLHNPRIPSAVYVEDVLGTDEYPGEGHDECAMGENDMTTTDTSPAAQIIARAQVAKELAEKATPGPWEVEKGSDLEGTPFCHIEGWTTLDHTDWLCLDPDDARFIAASRTLVPQMAAAVMTLVEARDEMYRQNNLISALIIFDDALTTAAAAMGDGDE